MNDLYKVFSKGNIRLSRCVRRVQTSTLLTLLFFMQSECHEVADKYVEYDSVLVVLDLILHRVGAYRHVLFNSGTRVGRQFGSRHVRLLVVYALLDAWLKCVRAGTIADPHRFAPALLAASVELLTFGAATLFAAALALTVRVPLADIAATLVLASFGRCFLVLPMIWAYSPALLTLFNVFVLTSNVAALRAFLSISLVHAAAIVAVGVLVRFAPNFAFHTLDETWRISLL